jgi:hypothetical protein
LSRKTGAILSTNLARRLFIEKLVTLLSSRSQATIATWATPQFLNAIGTDRPGVSSVVTAGPEKIKPSNYNIDSAPHGAKLTFEGFGVASIESCNATARLKVNMRRHWGCRNPGLGADSQHLATPRGAPAEFWVPRTRAQNSIHTYMRCTPAQDVTTSQQPPLLGPWRIYL